MTEEEVKVVKTNGHIASADDLFVTYQPKRRYRDVPLPMMGLTVRIQSLTEKELSEYQAATLDRRRGGFREQRLLDANRRLIAACLVDGDGEKLCTCPEHIQRIASWDGMDTQVLYDACAEHSGITKQDIEDLVGN